MNVKLVLGIVLFVIGIGTAVMGIVSVARPEDRNVTVVAADPNEGALESSFGKMAIPLVAGLSLGVGGLLIGLSMGNWTRPRTHLKRGDEAVDPEGYHKMKHV
jgi:hypothetical protein